MIDLKTVWIIGRKELQETLSNKWLIVYTLLFAGLALALSSLSQPDVEFTALASYNRTVASLVNLVLLFVPLIGLLFGATSLASERETGALDYLLAQPVSRIEVLLGKYIGVACALLASLNLGLGTAGIILAWQGAGGDANGYVMTVIMACLLGLAMLSIGFLISALAAKTATAIGGAIFTWLLFVFVGDLGLIGASLVTEMPIQTTLLVALLNPLQLFKMGAIFSAHTSLEVLGPVGLYATDTFDTNFMPLMVASLALWIVIPLLLAQWYFAKRGAA
ncbi:MAG: ABC transporter permease subunit [Anaerolineales bacterium]|nr:ABC transporter permease subunit [Anaerolineales bacterium]